MTGIFHVLLQWNGGYRNERQHRIKVDHGEENFPDASAGIRNPRPFEHESVAVPLSYCRPGGLSGPVVQTYSHGLEPTMSERELRSSYAEPRLYR